MHHYTYATLFIFCRNLYLKKEMKCIPARGNTYRIGKILKICTKVCCIKQLQRK